MIFGGIVSSPRGTLSPQQSLELANAYLEIAHRTKDPEITMVLCHDAEVSLTQAKKGAKRDEDQAVREEVATVYIGLGKVLDSRGRFSEAQASYKKAEKMGVRVQDQDRFAQSFDLSSNEHSSRATTTDSNTNTQVAKLHPSSSQGQQKRTYNIFVIPPHIFAENIRPPITFKKLPEPDERLINTSQLACCLSLLKASNSLDDALEQTVRDWLLTVENDPDEQERLKVLMTDVIRAFKRDELKDAKAVTEIVCLSSVLDKDTFRDLLVLFYDGVSHSDLLNFHQLDGLAQMIQGADPGYLDADDLVKILNLLSNRLRDTHQQSPRLIFQLTLAASRVLDAMADTKVEGLDREKLHEPLSSYLNSLKDISDPYLVYQVAYAYQALQCIPDDETLWQGTLRRTGKVIRGVSGLVSAVKGLDLNGFMEGLKDIQKGLAGATEVVKLVVRACDDVNALTVSGQNFMKALKEGFSFKRKCAWYTALRGADALIREGEFASFKKLVCEAPCRLDAAFQWGVCQRLGEVAANTMWDARTRRNAIAFLGEIYRNNEDWGHQLSVKEWIVNILIQLSSQSENVLQFAETLLQELKSDPDVGKQAIIQACQEKDPNSCPFKVPSPTQGSQSLLDRVQNKPDVEGNLRQLRKQRLKEQGNAVYIQPQAKAGLQAPDEERFPLMEKLDNFLGSNQKVFLLLGDSGAGKSTFNRHLECNLWQSYKKASGLIPLHIHLPAIDKPEQDMIAKHLRKAEFTEPEIRELKNHRKFILICDGYDESQQTHNLYTSNRLNQPGEWTAQMVISCRSEYLGVDYRDRFRPGDRNSQSSSELFQEAVITPFTPDQVDDYITQYVTIHQPLWEAKQYKEALDLIPSLKDLVKNPFLMTLSLEVLPRMVDPGQHLSTTRVTRVALYDEFIEHWLERGKKRLGEKELSPQAKAAFESLIDEGFSQNGIDFLKKLSVSIYKEQDGQPIVRYSRYKDGTSWKAEFFNREDEKQLLREACPLTRSGNQHRFIHRSLLEYGLALAVFDPLDWRERAVSESVMTRRGSTDSTLSDEDVTATEAAVKLEQEPDSNSPLVWRNFVKEASVLQFLEERAQQEPVFEKQLLNYIERSKTDKKWRTAAANAITILVRAGVQFNGADLRGIRIPKADLSYGVFDSAQLQRADLRRVNLRGVWLRQADLNDAHMAGVQFGELPFLNEESAVESCAYSPDGKSLAASLVNGNISVYTTSDWKTVWTLTGHSEQARSVAYSPKGDRIASGSFDDTVRLWDAETGECCHILTGHENDIYSVAFSPQGDTIASGSEDKTIRLWNVETGTFSRMLTGHSSTVTSIMYSPNGNQIASGSNDRTMRLWNAETGECLLVLSGHGDVINSVAYSPQGDMLASGGYDKIIRLWDVETRLLHRTFLGHTNTVRCISYSPRGDLFASSSFDRTVRLWDVDTGTCLHVFTGHYGSVRAIIFSPKGDYIASGSDDRTVRVLDPRIGASRHVPKGHTQSISGIKYSPNGCQVVSSSEDRTIRLWDVETGSCRHTLRGHCGQIDSIVYSAQGDLVASASDDKTVRLWDAETGLCGHILSGHDVKVRIVVFSPQGDQVASGYDDGTVKLWDTGTGECLYTLSGHTREISNVVYSPNGKVIASGCWDSTVRLWDVETGECCHELTGHENEVYGVAYSPRGDTVASASDDGTARLWDVETGACRHVFTGHDDMVLVVVYSPNGNQIASASGDGTVRLWDPETGDCCYTMRKHTQRVTSLAYSSKGNLLASGSRDSTVGIWDVASGQSRAEIKDFKGAVNHIAWNSRSDVNYLVTGSFDGAVRQWQVIEEDDLCRVNLCWSSSNDALAMTNASMQDVRGLGRLDKKLLIQRGAVGEPSLLLREPSKKLISLLSVVSKLNSSTTVQDPSSSSSFSTTNPSAGHLEQEDEQADD